MRSLLAVVDDSERLRKYGAMEDLEDNISSHAGELGDGLIEAIDTFGAMPQVSLTNKPLTLGSSAQQTYAQVCGCCAATSRAR